MDFLFYSCIKLEMSDEANLILDIISKQDNIGLIYSSLKVKMIKLEIKNKEYSSAFKISLLSIYRWLFILILK